MDKERLNPPICVDFSTENQNNFIRDNNVTEVADTLDAQLEELFLIRNPRFKFIKEYKEDLRLFKEDYKKKSPVFGNWFFFQDQKKLLHTLPEEELIEVKTGRNKNLVTKNEQDKYYQSIIGIAGLSVGSHAATTIAMSCGSKNIKIADPDEVSLSNLNRVRYGLEEVSQNKTSLVEKFIYNTNPYSKVYCYKGGLDEVNAVEFFDEPKLDILVEEMDNLAMKIFLREEAKKRGIPVIMATDNGDNVIVDIERYDQEPNLELFNGVVGHITLEDFKNMNPSELPRLATKIAGKDFVVQRMQDSLLEVGKSLYSWPQLGTAATLSGVVVAYLVRKIINKEPLKSGKLEVNLDSIFELQYHNEENKNNREAAKKEFFKKIGLE
jgi:molybdopterin/thiamine biosynthesis adenylyltransferase